MNVRFVGNGPIVVGHKAIYPQETLEINLGSLETLRHQYGNVFVNLDPVVETPVEPEATSDLVGVVAEAPMVDTPSMGKKKK